MFIEIKRVQNSHTANKAPIQRIYEDKKLKLNGTYKQKFKMVAVPCIEINSRLNSTSGTRLPFILIQFCILGLEPKNIDSEVEPLTKRYIYETIFFKWEVGLGIREKMETSN